MTTLEAKQLKVGQSVWIVSCGANGMVSEEARFVCGDDERLAIAIGMVLGRLIFVPLGSAYLTKESADAQAKRLRDSEGDCHAS